MKNKYYDWDERKNQLLKAGRGVNFDDAIRSIDEGRILALEKHHNQKKYPGQRIYILEINDYAYMVPFVEDAEKRFLKTVFPSRKMTIKYLIRRKQ